MAKKVRRKAAAKTKVRRAKAKTRVKAKTKASARAKPKAQTKVKAKTKKVAKRKSPRPTAQTGIVATVTSAFQAVTDTIKDTALLRRKIEPPGTSS